MQSLHPPLFLRYVYVFLILVAVGTLGSTLNRFLMWDRSHTDLVVVQLAYGIPSVLLSALCILSMLGIRRRGSWGWALAIFCSIAVMAAVLASAWVTMQIPLTWRGRAPFLIEDAVFFTASFVAAVGLLSGRVRKYFRSESTLSSD